MSDISARGGSVSFKMSGLDVLDKAVKKLSDKVQKQVLNKAARAGARVVQKRAKSLAPVKSGALRRAIRVVTLKMPKGQAKAAVTIKSGKGEKREAFYAHFVEFGTRKHAIGRGSVKTQTRTGRPGQQRGAIHPGTTAKPFMRPAFDETEREQLDAIGDTLAKEIIKAHDKI
jgi:HK97 gp10 family phage protein